MWVEMHQIIDKTEFDLNPVLFRANHVSNARPIGGMLPHDKLQILSTLAEWIRETPEGIYPKPPSQM